MAIRHVIQRSNEEGPWEPDMKMVNEVLSELRKRDIPIYTFENREYTASQLIDEVAEKTSAGRAFYKYISE